MVGLEEIYFNITGKCVQHNEVQTAIFGNLLYQI
jgi:hypothetical protein